MPTSRWTDEINEMLRVKPGAAQGLQMRVEHTKLAWPDWRDVALAPLHSKRCLELRKPSCRQLHG